MSDASGDSFDLSGRVVVVTGGSRGLGRAMCHAFAGHGATVVVASRKLDACQAVVDEIAVAGGPPALAVACHVGRWADCDGLTERVYERLGQADVLVNNAGMSPLYPSLPEVSAQLWDKVIAVNLGGAFRLMTTFGTRMAARGNGCIINVSSIEATAPLPHALPYAAAKAGLEALSAGMARALAPNVRVNVIRPGPFRTDISTSWDRERWEKAVAGQIPLRRGGEPDEITGAALYLASRASSFTTGAVIKVDGGISY